MRNNISNLTFHTYEASNSVVNESYFELPNKTKYLIFSFFICFLQFFFVKCSNSFFIVKIINNISPCTIFLTFVITKTYSDHILYKR